jgi:hypothetical protein
LVSLIKLIYVQKSQVKIGKQLLSKTKGRHSSIIKEKTPLLKGLDSVNVEIILKKVIPCILEAAKGYHQSSIQACLHDT